MTNHPSINHPTYFLQSSFLPDGHAMVFTSYRTGTAQLYLAPFPGGELRQLTDGPPIHPFSPALHCSGKHAYFVRGGAIWSIDLQSLEEENVVAFEDAQLGECSLNAGGDWLT